MDQNNEDQKLLNQEVEQYDFDKAVDTNMEYLKQVANLDEEPRENKKDYKGSDHLLIEEEK